MVNNNICEAAIKRIIPVFRVLLELYKEAKNTNDENFKKWVYNSLERVCHLECFVTPYRVSKRAEQKAKERYESEISKINDISKCTWEQQIQKTQMNDNYPKKRAIFHLEHVYPISKMISDLEGIAGEMNGAISDEEYNEKILNLLKKFDMAWILKEERVKLDTKYKTDRPHPLRTAFDDDEVDIKMVDDWN